MGAIYILRGLLIYIYAFDHNPPHIHVRGSEGEFTVSIKDRIVEGKAKSKDIALINEFLDKHYTEVIKIWETAQRGGRIEKIR
ncbi:MAG: DUF4160 domain-containing protein [Muribaculaceae bacterium]|nr:DUF4160 domain-containing protein [Muribaculaceae bacterium]